VLSFGDVMEVYGKRKAIENFFHSRGSTHANVAVQVEHVLAVVPSGRCDDGTRHDGITERR